MDFKEKKNSKEERKSKSGNCNFIWMFSVLCVWADHQRWEKRDHWFYRVVEVCIILLDRPIHYTMSLHPCITDFPCLLTMLFTPIIIVYVFFSFFYASVICNGSMCIRQHLSTCNTTFRYHWFVSPTTKICSSSKEYAFLSTIHCISQRQFYAVNQPTTTTLTFGTRPMLW